MSVEGSVLSSIIFIFASSWKYWEKYKILGQTCLISWWDFKVEILRSEGLYLEIRKW